MTDLDAAAVNERLLAVYERAWPALAALTQRVDGSPGLHLPAVPVGFAEADIRVAVVGQQPMGFGSADSARAQMALVPADGIVGRQRGSPFWTAARQVTDALAGRPGAPVL